jgi:hypothetical protein
MQRRAFITSLGGFFGSAALWPLSARAQNPPDPNQAADDEIGQVATLQGIATVTRGNAAAAALKVNDAIFKDDVLQTGANSSLGVTFDDETTFSLSANARMVIDEFVYQDGGTANSALFNVLRGTVAFVASQVAKTGAMKIATPTATLGIRGTTGVVDVPDNAAAGGGEARIKLYPDADGRVGQIEVFDRQGGRLGALTQGSSAFAIRPGAGGRFAAVAFQIPLQEAARDRGVVQRLFVSHNIGRRLAIQRRQLRIRNPQRPNNLRPNNQRPNNQRPNNLRQPNGPLQPNQNPGGQQPGRLRRNLQKLNPFDRKKRPPETPR